MGNINEDEAILMGAAICDALTYLHTRKPPILHRDLKPGNVKITPDGHIFLVDFGLAKVLHGSQATTTGARAMTPGYSPPEQYGTARTDPRTDIYSLGATIYASLSGIIPEDGLARAMDNTQLTPLRKRNSKVSRQLAAAIEKAMGIDPADRFQNAEEFKRALLGSKSKTQRLPGDYVIQPSPAGADEQGQKAIERESMPPPDMKASNSKDSSPSREASVFKPPRKKRKGRRTLSLLFWSLFLLAAGIVGVVQFRPDLVPPDYMNVISSWKILPLPFFSSMSTPTMLPASTGTISTLTASTLTPTLAPTETLLPTKEVTPTPSNTPIPVATHLGGGFGQVAFASTRSGIPQIYLVNADGTGLTQMTSMENGACQPSWSPDGLQFVFISPCRARGDFYETAYKDSSLYVINANGTDLKSLTVVPGSDFDPSWSPDGRRIAFTSMRDGRKEIYILTVESQAVTRLTTTTGDIENSQPSWSPLGNQILYTVKRVGAYQIWSMTDTGQDNVQVVRSGQQLWDFSPIWMPDGETILFNQRNLGPSQPWLMSIRFADRETQNPTKLNLPTPIEDVQYSPDGLWIIFDSQDGEVNRDIYFMTTTGGDRTRLTNDPNNDFDPAWRPASKP
jgi:Tol biopolymer transport system component